MSLRSHYATFDGQGLCRIIDQKGKSLFYIQTDRVNFKNTSEMNDGKLNKVEINKTPYDYRKHVDENTTTEIITD